MFPTAFHSRLQDLISRFFPLRSRTLTRARIILGVCTVTVSALFVCFAEPANAERVFPQQRGEQAIENLKESVSHLMTLSEEELRERVPVESGGIWFTDCPNCEYGSQDRGRFEWRPEKPQQIKCEGCGEVYPDNPDYPDDQYIEIDAPEGVHRFHYWENPDDGYRIFLRAHADYLHRMYLERGARNMARIYASTGDEEYAWRSAVLLHRIAEVVPGYAYIFDFPYRQKEFTPYTQNRIPGVPDYRTSLWTRWAYNCIPRPLIEAYDVLYDWDGWEEIGGPDVRETIEEDLFTYIIEFVQSFEDPLTNMSPRIWRDSISAGWVMERPEWVHESIYRFERMLDQQFMHDGHWYETSPSYHAMTINGMRAVMEAAAGYSDPEGYTHPETGRRFDDLELEKEVPQYGLAIRILDETRLPDGRLLPVNDTWAVHGRMDRETRDPRDSSESLFTPGLGVSILGTGEGDEQFFSWLNFTSGRAHKQRDTLSIGLFGFGKEFLSDIGYTHTRYRRSWASSMMSHNTVVVDGRESKFDYEHTGNRPVAFASHEDGFHLAAAESFAAYEDRTDRYRRTLILLGNDATDAYLIDVFEVAGGEQHDYLLHGSADEDSHMEIGGADLAPYDGSLVNPGAEYEEPRGEHDEMGREGSFSFIEDLSRGETNGPLQVDLRLDADDSLGTRSLIAEMDNAEAFLGRSPSLRRAAESDARIDDYYMPSFVLRRKGEELDSVFVAAHEAVKGEPDLEAIHARRDGDRIWIAVTRKDGVDFATVALNRSDHASFNTQYGTFATDASYAVVRVDREGEFREAHLVEGERLQFGEHGLRGPGRLSGEVRGMRGGGAGETVFELDEALSLNAPDILIVEFPDGTSRGYTVSGVDNAGEKSEVHVREAAGFRVESDRIEITSFPQRTIDGSELRYRLIDSAHGAE